MQQPRLENVMELLYLTIKTTITARQAMKLFMAKNKRFALGRALLLHVSVSDARGVADSLVLDNIVHHASPGIMNVMRAMKNPTRRGHITCATLRSWLTLHCRSSSAASRSVASLLRRMSRRNTKIHERVFGRSTSCTIAS